MYPILIRGRKRKTFPLLLIAMAIAYNCANGYVNGYHLFISRHVYPTEWITDPRFIIGIVLFVTGLVMHIHSDAILRKLRSSASLNVRRRSGDGSSREPPESGVYRIPYGGMFRFVSSPNYPGEIIEWCGFALATWSTAGLSFAVFTIANLLPRAISNHRWYLKTFADYPRNRQALIPFIL